MGHLVLIADADAALVGALEQALAREFFVTEVVASGGAALLRALGEPRPGLVLLDLMLPDMSGVEVCRRLRADLRTRALPVIMLSARGSEMDRIVGLEAGADDYVVKPFSTRELVLRARAVLRGEPAERTGELVLGRLRVTPDEHRVRIDGEDAPLTALEFRLLLALVARPGHAYTREALLAEVWGQQAEVTTRTVDMHVLRLRKKLGAAGEYVQTVRGIGYCLVQPRA